MVRSLAALIRLKAYKNHLVKGAYKTQGAFEMHVWAYMRDFFTSGDPNAAFAFVDNMASEIENQYHRAWNEGARELGVDPSDMTQEDLDQLQIQIGSETELITGVAGDIENFKAEGGHTDAEFNSAFRNRAFMWSNRYSAIMDQARTYFGSMQKFEWVMGPTEQHCHTGDNGRPGVGCADLAGIVLWGREWEQTGIAPQNDRLNCGGWQCQCRKEPTDKRRTRGGLGRVLDMMTAAHV